MKQKLGLCCALIHDPTCSSWTSPPPASIRWPAPQFWDLIARIRTTRPGMSVLVATAYMDEAQRFDWLVAMDAGAGAGHRHARRAAERRPARSTLEAAFIALLPAEKKRGHAEVVDPAAAGARATTSPSRRVT